MTPVRPPEGTGAATGAVMRQPVRYQASGERVLEGGLLRLQMFDVARPPQYPAEVFLGYDPKAGDYWSTFASYRLERPQGKGH